MANLQVGNIPDNLYERLRKHARRGNRTISATVLAAVGRELAWSEWESRLARQPTTNFGVAATTSLADEQAQRDSRYEVRSVGIALRRKLA